MQKNKKVVTVVDYEMGNLFNITRAFETLDCEVNIEKDREVILNSDRLILPGVGAFEDGIKDLVANNLDEVILQGEDLNIKSIQNSVINLPVEKVKNNIQEEKHSAVQDY